MTGLLGLKLRKVILGQNVHVEKIMHMCKSNESYSQDYGDVTIFGRPPSKSQTILSFKLTLNGMM